MGKMERNFFFMFTFFFVAHKKFKKTRNLHVTGMFFFLQTTSTGFFVLFRAAQPTNVENAPSNSTAETQQQFIDLERWNALKQQQAQKRIIEHLMYSGRPEEETAPTVLFF